MQQYGLLQKYFETWRIKANKLCHQSVKIFLKSKLMSLSDAPQSYSKEIQTLSKREQMKLKAAVRLIQKEANSNDKPHKRTTQHLKKHLQANPRKLIKTDNVSNSEKSDQLSSSHHEQEQKIVVQKEESENKPLTMKKQIYNPAYQVPDGEDGIFTHMLEYTYQQKEKILEMQDLDWERMNNLGTETLTSIPSNANKEATRKVMQRLIDDKQKAEVPFSKSHKQFTKKYINLKYLIS